MAQLRVGIMDFNLVSRPRPESLTRAAYLTAVANRIDFSGAQDLLPFNIDEQTALAHLARVPQALLRETTLTGTPQEVIEQAAQWRDCGAGYIVLANGGPLQRSLRKGLMSMQPFSKILRRLKKL